ncbi:MAG: topoisomerase DNA-binding C4 zinc finger domain-containing protein [Parasporobacterium sp.]|nr:topoisomerase DNA-binding C4 zinc finger domain-containing protein [Parasporobacterium sp.]
MAINTYFDPNTIFSDGFYGCSGYPECRYIENLN